MANSFVRYTGNNSTTSYSIPFSYRSTADLIVTLSGSTTTAFTLNGAGTTLTFNSAPAQDAAIEIRRKTSQGTKLVDYASGSVLTENDLDTDSDQAFFMSQEAIDDAGDVIKISNTDFQWDAQNKRLTNVADPTAAQHAATKNYLENTWLSATDKATLTNVNSNISAINNVNSNSSNINAVNSNATNINTVATNIPSVNTVATDIAKVIAVANDLAEAVSEVETVADDLNEATSEIDTVATNIANVNIVGGLNTEITTLAGLNTEISALYGIRTAISGVNTISANVTAVNNNSANINTLAGLNTEITALGQSSVVTNINTVATNLPSINSFAERYRVQAGVPASSNDVGDLVFDTTAQKLKVFDGSSYALAGSSVNGTSSRHTFTATAGQTTFTTDDAGTSLAYDVASGTAFADVYLNGVKLLPSDFTATNGTSIVLDSATAVNDTLQVVAYGTFTLASFSASNLTSGIIDGDRLPSPTLTVKGDGSSTDGAIQLNCSQNSHGVKIKSPPHSAGQSYTLTLPQSITNGYYLKTDGSGNLSFAEVPQPVVPTVADVSQTIAPATATTINITGTNFVSIPIVEFIKTDGSVTLANTVSFTSATSLSVNVTLATGNYHVRVENPDGNAGRSTNNILTASASPSFSTSAGSLGTFAGNFSGTVATIAGSSDSAITFSEVGSNLTTANVTLNTSNGALTTTDFGGASTTPTTYNFTIRITDAENQTTDRAFSFTSSYGATGGAQFN